MVITITMAARSRPGSKPVSRLSELMQPASVPGSPNAPANRSSGSRHPTPDFPGDSKSNAKDEPQSRQSNRSIPRTAQDTRNNRGGSQPTGGNSGSQRTKQMSRPPLHRSVKPPSEEDELSWKLSEVMADVGITRELVRFRRLLWGQRDNLWTVLARLDERLVTEYTFGSQSDGATIPGLLADFDHIKSHQDAHIIENVSDMTRGRDTFLLHQTSTTPPGYRALRPMKDDTLSPVTVILKKQEHDYRQVEDAICLYHSLIHDRNPDGVRHGPALKLKNEEENLTENFVRSFYTTNWPNEADDWRTRTEYAEWPSAKLRQTMVGSGCLLIPVGHKQSSNKTTEFRLSLELAERMLMFDMNITQIRCLTLLKVLLKFYVNGKFDGQTPLKSYHAKTALWHIIEKSKNENWDQSDLLKNTMKCLNWFHKCVSENRLPHYLMPSVDLLEGRLDHVPLREALLEILTMILENPRVAIKNVTIDDIGKRLLAKYDQGDVSGLVSPGLIHFEIMSKLIGSHTFKFLRLCYKMIHSRLSFNDLDYNIGVMKKYLAICKHIKDKVFKENTGMQNAVAEIKSMFCSTLGCLLGAQNKSKHLNKYIQAHQWLLLGQESDLTSGKLKLASAYYCAGEYQRAESTLQDVEDDYCGEYTMKVCGCRANARFEPNRGFMSGLLHCLEENDVRSQCAYCVVFTRSEKTCVPVEFQHEMYRSTTKEASRREAEDYWMDWACVDSLPFLYVLQYLTSTALKDKRQKKYALRTLHQVADTEDLYHEETVWNLLGQLYQKEQDTSSALKCYNRSLEIMPTNNVAAKFKMKLRVK